MSRGCRRVLCARRARGADRTPFPSAAATGGARSPRGRPGRARRPLAPPVDLSCPADPNAHTLTHLAPQTSSTSLPSPLSHQHGCHQDCCCPQGQGQPPDLCRHDQGPSSRLASSRHEGCERVATVPSTPARDNPPHALPLWPAPSLDATSGMSLAKSDLASGRPAALASSGARRVGRPRGEARPALPGR
jgi:hypothetical protein